MVENKKINWVFFGLVLLVIIISISLAGATRRPVEALEPVEPEFASLDLKGEANVDLFSGAATYSYSISVPPGTNGLQPEISLFYSSQNIRQKPGIVGSGWKLTESYIMRDVNGSTGNVSDDEFILILNGASYKLVFAPNENRFHSKIENYMYISNETGSGNDKDQYWIVKTKDGTAYRFGYYNFSEAVANRNDYVWRWYLDLINDTHGNQIFYNYTENPYANDIGSTYLNKIVYNNDEQREIEFLYGDEDRSDLWISTFDNGNKITQSRRLVGVLVELNDKLIRRYSLEYERLEEINSVTFLSNITEFGSDNSSTLPPTKFSYEKISPSWVDGSDTWNWINCGSDGEALCTTGWTDKDNGVRLVDVNNDGLTDIIKAINKPDEKGIADIRINNGTGWFNESGWVYPGCNDVYGSDDECVTTYDLHDNGVRFADVNGDGFVDIIRAKGIALWERGHSDIWINNKTGGWENDTGWVYPGCRPDTDYSDDTCFITYNREDNGVRLGDINGDGFVDIVKAMGRPEEDGKNEVWVNNQSGGWINMTNTWLYPGCRIGEEDSQYTCFIDYNRRDSGARLVDVNGDGLTDVLVALGRTDGKGTSDVWINNGTGWENNTGWVHPCRESSHACVATHAKYDNALRLTDLNGDGLIDLVRARGNHTGIQVAGSSEVWLNNGTGWTNSSTDIWSYPKCDDNNGTLCISTINGTDNGANFADVNGDGLLDIIYARGNPDESGHSEIWINNGSYSYLMNSITSSMSGVISISYQKSTYLNNTGDDGINDLGFNVWVVSSINRDNGIDGEHFMNYTYNYNYTSGYYDFELGEFRGFGIVNETASDKISVYKFHQDQAKNGREYSREVSDDSNNLFKKAEKHWNSSNENYFVVELLEESNYEYDGTSDNPKITNMSYEYDGFGNVILRHSLGDVGSSNDDKYEYFGYSVNEDAWIVDKINNYTLISSNGMDKIKETLYSYDDLAFGQTPVKGDNTKKEDWLNYGENPITSYGYNDFGNMVNETDPNGQVTEYIYGLRDGTHTFTDRMINSKNQETDYHYDRGSGNLVSDVDANNIVKNYTYDEFSIDKTTILPLDSETYPTQEYEYDFEMVDEGKINVKQREDAGVPDTLDTYRFYDGFGRLIQIKSEATDSRQIVVDFYYDDLGRISEQSNPYFVSFYENYSTPNPSVKKTFYSYDQLDRVTNITNPDGSKKGVSYNHWNITIYDENDNKIEYGKDSDGNIVLVKEYNNTVSYETIYEYDSQNNLILITDALGNIINYTYDSLGRKTSMIDPDLGNWNYSYDSTGNLINQTDNVGSILKIAYDELNRKTKESSSDGDVIYLYDLGKNNTLSQIITPEIGINYTYDDRLRKIQEEKIIDDLTFITEWSYDSSDRIISQLLPSGENLTFLYDDQGLLSSINGVSTLVYNEKNSLLNITYNNNLLSIYDYNSSNFRLKEIKTDNKQELDYTYDNVGNIVSINDTINARFISMIYDTLSRLTKTTISDTEETALTFTHDEIGNMVNITGSQTVNFYYDNDLAHAPSGVIYY